jgi:hypothetical protein
MIALGLRASPLDSATYGHGLPELAASCAEGMAVSCKQLPFLRRFNAGWVGRRVAGTSGPGA